MSAAFRERHRDYGEWIAADQVQAHLHAGWQLLDCEPNAANEVLLAPPPVNGRCAPCGE